MATDRMWLCLDLGQVSLGQHSAVMLPCDTSVLFLREKFFARRYSRSHLERAFKGDCLTVPAYSAWEAPWGGCAECLCGGTALDDVLQISLSLSGCSQAFSPWNRVGPRLH